MIIGTLKAVRGNKGISFDGDTDTEGDSDIEIVGERTPTGWAYIGSHNFTTSAWGSFGEKSTPFNPIFSVTTSPCVHVLVLLKCCLGVELRVGDCYPIV